MSTETPFTHYRWGRRLAALCTRLGVLACLVAAVFLVASNQRGGHAIAEGLLLIGAGLLLHLFGQVATAVFDIADRVLAHSASDEASPNAKRDPALPNRG